MKNIMMDVNNGIGRIWGSRVVGSYGWWDGGGGGLGGEMVANRNSIFDTAVNSIRS